MAVGSLFERQQKYPKIDCGDGLHSSLNKHWTVYLIRWVEQQVNYIATKLLKKISHFNSPKNRKAMPGVGVHACNPSIWE
jgi:hypothetical protein